MSENRHDTLIATGWRYDAAQDRYTPPSKAQAGTERWYNLDAAWAEYMAIVAGGPRDPRRKRQRPLRDPREQEPQ